MRRLWALAVSSCACGWLGCADERPAKPAADPSHEGDATTGAVDAGVVQGSEPDAATDASVPSPSHPDAAAPPESHPDAAAAPAAPIISNVSIEPNPNNVLSCTVRFETNVRAKGEVRFGVGTPEFRIRSKKLTRRHRILVIGMHADTNYALEVVATNDAGSDSVDEAFETGSLPEGVPVAEVTIDEPQSLSGWTLTNARIDSPKADVISELPAIFVMVDEVGIPVWYYVNGTSPDVRGDIAVELMDDGHVMVGPAPGEAAKEIDLGGNIIWEGPPQSDPAYHHEAKRLEDGSYVLLRDGGGVTVEQYDAEGTLLWDWRLSEHFEPTGDSDWCHGNSITFDLDEDVFYLNCRWEGTFKVQHSSGEILWFLSGTRNPDTDGDFEFVPEAGRFSDTHDPEFHDDGTVLFYDNQYGADQSRVVEYALDQEGFVATLEWEFPGAFEVDPWYRESWYSVVWGDADRLSNGNVLINAGLRSGGQTRIFEVTRAGQVVWELQFPEGIGTYRAQRVSALPLVEPLETARPPHGQ